jgi:prepilin-type N-terminal cleavage/methylation domain-containing protein
VKKTEANSMTERRGDIRQHGFSMIELMVSLTIILIISAIAITQLKTNLQYARIDAAMRQVAESFRLAREWSLSNRRYVQVTFPANNQMAFTQLNVLTPGAGANAPIPSLTLTLSPPLIFTLDGMPDTPDGYGNANAIEFEGVAGGPVGGMIFQSDGEFLDGATFLPINGTVFLGIAGQQATARAVTILGTTGRVRGWKSNGATTWYQF